MAMLPMDSTVPLMFTRSVVSMVFVTYEVKVGIMAPLVTLLLMMCLAWE